MVPITQRSPSNLKYNVQITWVGYTKKQKEHYDEFVCKKTPEKFAEDVQKKIDYGKENEVSNII